METASLIAVTNRKMTVLSLVDLNDQETIYYSVTYVGVSVK